MRCPRFCYKGAFHQLDINAVAEFEKRWFLMKKKICTLSSYDHKTGRWKDYLESCHVFISLRVQTVQIEWCLLRWDIEHRLLRLKLFVQKFLCFMSFLYVSIIPRVPHSTTRCRGVCCVPANFISAARGSLYILLLLLLPYWCGGIKLVWYHHTSMLPSY